VRDAILDRWPQLRPVQNRAVGGAA
jgi:hypothetical protein